MGIVALQQRGLIYQDDFSNPQLDNRWELAPNDTTRISLTEAAGVLRVKSGVTPARLFFTPLTDLKEFVLDMRNSFNPAAEGEAGGLIVYSDDSDYMAMEEYFDAAEGTAATYPWVRIKRDHNVYSAYWSGDGNVWNIEGTAGFDAAVPKIGMYLGSTSGAPLDVEEIRIFSSTHITVSNVIAGCKVTLKDGSGQTLSSQVCRYGQTEVKIDASALPQPVQGSFTVELANGQLYESTEVLTIWGGDKYSFEPNVDLYFIDESGVERALSENVEEFLGVMNTGMLNYRNIQMIARNHMTSGIIENVKLRLISYMMTDQYQRLVSLAVDSSGTMGPLSDEIALSAVPAGGEQRFWLQVRRETSANLTGNPPRDAYFGIDVFSTYKV
ncbi:hypothetical protein ACP26L_36310 (plasmid) [Paenibacillus sp. S-38]|uniref:beta-xylosidase family glycoside hydrolase n=1 Tax=Paenibacillus sp. S-38 TaxID=3416710 RepID=UPI003CF34F1B